MYTVGGVKLCVSVTSTAWSVSAATVLELMVLEIKSEDLQALTTICNRQRLLQKSRGKIIKQHISFVIKKATHNSLVWETYMGLKFVVLPPLDFGLDRRSGAVLLRRGH